MIIYRPLALCVPQFVGGPLASWGPRLKPINPALPRPMRSPRFRHLWEWALVLMPDNVTWCFDISNPHNDTERVLRYTHQNGLNSQGTTPLSCLSDVVLETPVTPYLETHMNLHTRNTKINVRERNIRETVWAQ